MTFEERTSLLNILSQLNDPLFALPVELSLQVFQHLPLFCIWTLQRVSRRWRDRLSSDDFIRAAVLRWQTHDDADSARSSEQIAAASLTGRAQHLKALCTGQPVSQTILDTIPTEPPQQYKRRLALKGSRLAYILRTSSAAPSSGNAVIIRDLISGEKRILQGFARENIMDVVLTNVLVAWITFDGSLYVSYHAKPPTETARAQLPSSQVKTLAADGEAIALIMHPRVANTSEVILYEAQSRRLQSFDLHRDLESSTSRAMFLDSDRRVINIFALKHRTAMSDDSCHHVREVRHLGLKFNGEWLPATSWPLEVNVDCSKYHYTLDLAYFRSTGYPNQHRLMAYGSMQVDQAYLGLQNALIFNTALGKIVALETSGWFPDTPPHRAIIVRDYIWKGQTCRPLLPEGRYACDVAMNDTFLVSVDSDTKMKFFGSNSIRVFCFDPGVAIAGPEESQEEE